MLASASPSLSTDFKRIYRYYLKTNSSTILLAYLLSAI